MNINVHIERLILDGLSVPHRERPMLQAAVEAELARLLTDNGLAPHLLVGGAMPRLQGGDVQMGGEGGVELLGRQIAQAVHGGIGQ
jgi:hypothetical protein